MCQCYERTLRFIELQIEGISRALFPCLNGCECAIQLALYLGHIDQGQSIELMRRVSDAEEARAKAINGACRKQS